MPTAFFVEIESLSPTLAERCARSIFGGSQLAVDETKKSLSQFATALRVYEQVRPLRCPVEDRAEPIRRRGEATRHVPKK